MREEEAGQHGRTRGDRWPSASSASARVATRPDRGNSVAAPTTAVHLDLGVRITAPPRTESSMPMPMATNPVTRRLAFNTMSPQPVGATRRWIRIVR
eukprot:3950763-Pleurochrysis_carterae.AAC.1